MILMKISLIKGGSAAVMKNPGEAICSKHLLLPLVLSLSFIFKLAFLFKYSGYQHHLIADMAGFWYRADARYQGDIFGPGQWLPWPGFYTLFLVHLFKVAHFFGLSALRLEMTLVLSVILSTISVFLVYKIAEDLTGDFVISLTAAAAYGFCYPVIYLNTLILPENLGMPLLIATHFFVLRKNQSAAGMAGAGCLLGLADTGHALFGLMGIPFFLYIFFCKKISWRSLARALCFAGGIFLILLFLAGENHYISKGRLTGLADYQGLDFFMRFCKPYNVFSSYPGYGGALSFNNPVFLEPHPEYGRFLTNHPLHDYGYFFREGLRCIQENPGIWGENLKALTEALAGSLLTSFLTASILLFYWTAPKSPPFLQKMTLLLSPLFCTLLAGYFFTLKSRYLIPSLYGLFIVFFAVLPYLLKNWKKGIVYYACLLSVFLFFYAYGLRQKSHWRQAFRVERLRTFPLERAGRVYPDGTPGNQMGMLMMPDLKSAVLLESMTPRTAKEIEISTDSWDSYKVEFYFKDHYLGEIFLPLVRPRGGIYRRVLPMPEALKGKAFNQILVRPVQGDGVYSLAYLILK